MMTKEEAKDRLLRHCWEALFSSSGGELHFNDHWDLQGVVFAAIAGLTPPHMNLKAVMRDIKENFPEQYQKIREIVYEGDQNYVTCTKHGATDGDDQGDDTPDNASLQ